MTSLILYILCNLIVINLYLMYNVITKGDILK